jgi:hypothetical protein
MVWANFKSEWKENSYKGDEFEIEWKMSDRKAEIKIGTRDQWKHHAERWKNKKLRSSNFRETRHWEAQMSDNVHKPHKSKDRWRQSMLIFRKMIHVSKTSNNITKMWVWPISWWRGAMMMSIPPLKLSIKPLKHKCLLNNKEYSWLSVLMKARLTNSKNYPSWMWSG